MTPNEIFITDDRIEHDSVYRRDGAREEREIRQEIVDARFRLNERRNRIQDYNRERRVRSEPIDYQERRNTERQNYERQQRTENIRFNPDRRIDHGERGVRRDTERMERFISAEERNRARGFQNERQERIDRQEHREIEHEARRQQRSDRFSSAERRNQVRRFDNERRNRLDRQERREIEREAQREQRSDRFSPTEGRFDNERRERFDRQERRQIEARREQRSDRISSVERRNQVRDPNNERRERFDSLNRDVRQEREQFSDERQERRENQRFDLRLDNKRVESERRDTRASMNRISNQMDTVPETKIQKSLISSELAWQLIQLTILGAIIVHIIKKDETMKPNRCDFIIEIFIRSDCFIILLVFLLMKFY